MNKQISMCSIALVFSIIFYGCKKEALEINADLEGEWNSYYFDSHAGSKIIIENDGSATYEEGVGSSKKIYSGKSKIKNNVLKIGRADLSIITYPAFDGDGNYYFETDLGKFTGVYAVVDPATIVTGNTVEFTWTRLTNPAEWSDDKLIEYRTIPTSVWTTLHAPSNSSNYILTALAPSTTYEWRIRTVRGIHYSNYSAIQTFTTN